MYCDDNPSKLTASKLKRLPVNLRKKAIREARNRNESIVGAKKRKNKRRLRKKPLNSERAKHEALVAATQAQLRQILSECEVLSDISYDCTPEELLGEIAIAEGHATTIFVQRDGLSTLTVVLHQEDPTIAQLKRSIAALSRIEHTRRQRERHEERLRRRLCSSSGNESVLTTTTSSTIAGANSQQVNTRPRSTGELVCSATRNGHQHRANVSWRFLWRAFALYNVDTNQVIVDDNGRKTLTELGIENAATLKFCHRIKYFGRKRQ